MNPKKRILFVDDEAPTLQALERMLRPMRDQWEMEFVDSGQKALAQMAESPFDVIVSDMRMPGMNGAELLNEVMKLYPQTMRLILSAYPDQEMVMKCVGSTHQYLMKPCAPDDLKATLLRASALKSSLRNEALTRLVSQMTNLPSLPALYLEIVDLLESVDVDLEQVGAVIARDIGMTAKILQLVNSAFFGLPLKLSTPLEAVTYLGPDTIKSLVLSIDVFAQFQPSKSIGFSLTSLTNHSLAVGAQAQRIGRAENAGYKLVSECFVGGMLHDTGKLVLASRFPAQYAQAVEQSQQKKIRLWQAEQEIFGATHADVGGYVLGLWGLPVPVVEAVALHHSPTKSFAVGFTPLTAVHVANALVQEKRRTAEGISSLQVDSMYLTELGLLGHLPRWRNTVP